MSIIERKVKARAAAMGLTLQQVAENGGVSQQALMGWFRAGKLTDRGRQCIKDALGVTDVWLDSPSLADVGHGLDELLVK